MRTTLELNVMELKQAMQNGVLLGLAEACLGLEERGGQAPAPVAAPVVMPTPVATPAPAAVAPVVLTPAPVPVAAAPAPAPAAVPTAVPAPVAAPPTAVPTVAPSYTISDLAVAGTQLVDAGRRQDVLNLLGTFGCAALTELPPEQYGAYALRLREMGAKL